jgi:hypothetical protein
MHKDAILGGLGQAPQMVRRSGNLTPSKLYHQSPYQTPIKGAMHEANDIRQVTQIFDNMKIDVLNRSPQISR